MIYALELILTAFMRLGNLLVAIANAMDKAVSLFVALIAVLIFQLADIIDALTGLMDYIALKLDDVQTLLLGGVVDPAGAADLQLLSFMNTFFPLAEDIAMIGGLTVLWLACTTIRLIVSIIPTVGG